ncbi:hypothetical protein F0562_008659 [Nyssa sinensis]|uniref:Uncharacterized protein n=1 Tax=Nyssa sinensis TaxID=561372 RepID=A0A5J5AB54_9ASTE|nr:hypothetical protein F0562_008659 [Nyssa sinensis]
MFESRLVSLLKKNKALNCIYNVKGSTARVLNEPSLNPCRVYSNVAGRSTTSLTARNSILYGFRSFHHQLRHYQKEFYIPSFRNMSTMSSANMINKEGLKLLVTAGPRAQKMVGIWLFASASWVFSMVVLGGITRLTRSGLSMTDWKFTGQLPPLSDDDWLTEFEKYKQSPEYKRVNKGMSIEDFKFIYWMEYAHLRLSALFALGAGQGLIGWWMVKSGLEEPASEYAQPRVSPYRLAAHLTSAFVIYSGLVWTALSVLMPEPPAESLSWVRGAAKVKRLTLPVSILVGITAVSGAFVAGNDAGHAFNTFPKMGDMWIPDDIFSMKPLMRNFFENTSTVQLDHRILATATLVSIGRLMVGSTKAGHSSCHQIFNWNHHGHGCSSGHFGDINTSIICACFSRYCSSGWSFNSSNTNDTAQSHCPETIIVKNCVYKG